MKIDALNSNLNRVRMPRADISTFQKLGVDIAPGLPEHLQKLLLDCAVVTRRELTQLDDLGAKIEQERLRVEHELKKMPLGHSFDPGIQRALETELANLDATQVKSNNFEADAPERFLQRVRYSLTQVVVKTEDQNPIERLFDALLKLLFGSSQVLAAQKSKSTTGNAYFKDIFVR